MPSDEPNIEDLRAEIALAASSPDVADRALRIVAAIEAVAAPIGIHPVIVGGMAVYIWTASEEFTTRDIDVVMEVPEQLAKAFNDLGFIRTPNGRHWTLAGTDVYLEAPSSHLDADAGWAEFQLSPGRSAKVLSRVDILMERLDEFQATGHGIPALQALALVAGLTDSQVRDLEARAAKRGITHALAAIRRILTDLEAGHSPPESDELHEIARAALRAEYHQDSP